MGRIRTIKPDLFTDEDLSELSPLHRLLFIGLWTESDRRGRLADKPKSLKAKLLPWDDCDIDELLWDLHERGFIARYTVGDLELISIPKFEKHQRPHPKEADFGFPDPVAGRETSRKAVERFSTIPSSPRSSPAGKGREGDLGKEGKGKEVAGALADASPPLPETLELLPQEPKKPARRAEVSDLLVRLFKDIHGGDYAFEGAKDALAVGRLLKHDPDDAEIERRYRAHCGASKPQFHGIAAFVAAWNAYAGHGATSGAPKDLRKGTVRAEDQHHDPSFGGKDVPF